MIFLTSWHVFSMYFYINLMQPSSRSACHQKKTKHTHNTHIQRQTKQQKKHRQLLHLSVQKATGNPEMVHSPGNTRWKTSLETGGGEEREWNKIARGSEFHSWSISNNHPPFSSPFPFHFYTPLLLSTCLHQTYPGCLENVRLKHLIKIRCSSVA